MRKLILIFCLLCMMFTIVACSNQEIDNDIDSVFGLESDQEEKLSTPENETGNTVLSVTVKPNVQQVFYLWEEDNVPTITNYTENTGNYFGDSDFQPYITNFPVPEGTPIKGAILVCPGGFFQFRSNQNEGVNVAEKLSELGYQSFVVDYQLQPYIQQEGALDLVRAVRFVRYHADDYGID
jgi:acetyl esterase/lipase